MLFLEYQGVVKLVKGMWSFWNKKKEANMLYLSRTYRVDDKFIEIVDTQQI